MDFGLIVDVETTGLDAKQDKIIEIGIVEFCAAEGEAPAIVSCYGALNDPGFPITDEITRITGITNRQLAGQAIDWGYVRQAFERASIVIAHNAEFDRAFIEASGVLNGLAPHWACSMRHIDWMRHGYGTRALNYLAADHGFVNPFAHRAVFDCATTFRLVAPYLQELIARSYEREFMVKAVGSPFETKDALKQRGYRWAADERCWSKVVAEGQLGEEREWLGVTVYKGASMHVELEMTRS